MTINKIIIISSIVPVIQHGRQGLCRLNLTGMVANHLFESIHNFLRSKQVILSLTLKERAIHVYLARLLLQNSSIDNFALNGSHFSLTLLRTSYTCISGSFVVKVFVD